MAISNYTGWSSHCNRVILDSTTITVGENATRSSELEQGNRRTALKSLFVPDKYSVVMEFEWEKKDEYGKSELQYFYEWYKYKHKYGTVPFEFPKILYSPNSGIRKDDDKNAYGQVEFYKITSAIEISKSASKVQVSMTWVSVYGGIISITERKPEVNFIEATRNYLDIHFTSVGDLIPCSQDFYIYIDSKKYYPTGFYYDGFDTVRLYFDYSNSGTSGTHTISFEYNYITETSQFSIPNSQYTTTFDD